MSHTLVPSVDSVTVQLVVGATPYLVVTAIGTVPTTGWTHGHLEPRGGGSHVKDGVYEFDFYATKPTGVTGDTVSKIHGAGVVHDRQGVKAVRVFAHEGSKEVPAP